MLCRSQWLDFFLCIFMFPLERGMTLMYIVILISQHLWHKLCMNLVFLIRFVYMYMSMVECFFIEMLNEFEFECVRIWFNVFNVFVLIECL